MQQINRDTKKIPFKELKQKILKLKDPEKRIKLGEGVFVFDHKAFINGYIHILENNSGKKIVLPYYRRLLLYYDILSK